VSIAGIAPLDWLLDDTGPIARNVTDAAIALTVMAARIQPIRAPLDQQPRPSPAPTPNTSNRCFEGQALRCPGLHPPRHGYTVQGVPNADPDAAAGRIPLRPETRAAFMRAIEGLRAAGATVVIDDAILPDSFPKMVGDVKTCPTSVKARRTSSRPTARAISLRG